MWSHGCFGSAGFGIRTWEYAHKGLRLSISGEDLTDYLRDGSLKITDSLGATAQCELELVDTAGAKSFEPGSTVIVTWNDVRAFGGTIDEVEEHIPGIVDPTKIHVLHCKDWNALAGRFPFAMKYTNQTLEYILNDIIFNQTNLWMDGITLGHIESVPLIEKAIFDWDTPEDAFKDLAEATGLNWNIDPYLKLNFFLAETYTAPFQVGDSNQVFADLIYKRSKQDYRNRQIIKGGIDYTDVKVEKFTGSPATTPDEKKQSSWSLRYNVGKMISILRGGIPQRVGIKNTDETNDVESVDEQGNPTWKQFFYDVGEKEIVQNNGRKFDPNTNEQDLTINPPLLDTETLEVTYQGGIPLTLDSIDDLKILERRAIEGGSGEYGEVTQDNKIDGRDLAAFKAKRLLEIYGRIQGELNFTTFLPGLAVGHLQDVTLAAHGLSSVQMLVDSIAINWAPNCEDISCQVTLLDGERQQRWDEFLRLMADAGKRASISPNSKINISRPFHEQVSLSDAVRHTEDGGEALHSWTDDPYSIAWFGGVVLGTGERIGSFVWGRSRFGSHA